MKKIQITNDNKSVSVCLFRPSTKQGQSLALEDWPTAALFIRVVLELVL